MRLERRYHRCVARLLATAVAFLVVGCGGDSPAEPATITGTYTLQTINGSPLPYVNFQNATDKDEIVSETFTLAAGGQWAHTYRERITTGGTVLLQDGQTAGTYTGSSAALSFTSSSNEKFTGSLNGGTLTILRIGKTLVYTR